MLELWMSAPIHEVNEVLKFENQTNYPSISCSLKITLSLAEINNN